jgi:transcriptional regulator with XRE-family HTH domain
MYYNESANNQLRYVLAYLLLPYYYVLAYLSTELLRVRVLSAQRTKTGGTFMATLYKRLATLCEERGIKGGRMCAELGLSKSLMTDLKMGRKTGVSAVTAQKIADYFGVTVGYLLGTEDLETKKAPGEENLTEGEKAMLELFRAISEDQQPIVLNMIKAALGGGK